MNKYLAGGFQCCHRLNNGPQRYQVLISGTCQCYLIKEKALCRCDLEMGWFSWIIWVGPKWIMCISLQERGKGRYDCTQRGKGDMRTELRKTEDACLQAMEWCDYKLRNAGSHRKPDSPLESLEGAWHCGHLGCGFLVSTHWLLNLVQINHFVPQFLSLKMDVITVPIS